MGVQPSIRQIGQYQILEILGQGGMGIVYRALDPAIGKSLAIKMLKSSYAEDPDLLERFYREAKATANLQHRNIVGVYSLGHQDGKPYIVMEYLEGSSASEIIASRRALPLVDKLDLVIQVCEGLQYAHDRGLIHRDIKPANVIVLQDGTAKIVDFGIVRVGGGQTLTQTGQLMGSPWYMSPEQINALPLDARTDIFSTGVMLFELLTYRLPFKGDDATSTFMKILRDEAPSLSDFLQNYPPELDDVLKRVLAKKVDERYQTAEELGFDLLQVQKGLRRGIAIGLIGRAEAAIRRGELEKAKLDLQEVLKFDRQDDRANVLLREVRQRIQQQQRAEQVVQMLSQAQVALAGEQYEEALASADQALRLNPQDPESIQLRNEIQEKFSRHKAVHESLRRAESSLLAGDFDDAKAEVQQALQIDPANAEGRALLGVVEKELKERSRRIAVQGFVDGARKQISERKFSIAIDALRQAEQLDPSDSNVRELLGWALRGQEQEKRRDDIKELTSKIDGALRSEDFASACTLCELALAAFPEEPTLLKLKGIAERQRDITRRRSYVQEQSLAIRQLMDREDPDAAVRLLEEALRTYPNEPNLEKLGVHIRAELGRLKEKREKLAQQEAEKRAEALANDKQRQTVLEGAALLRRMLDAGDQIGKLEQQSRILEQMLSSVGSDDQVLAVCSPLLHEVQSRIETRNHALEELGRCLQAAEQSLDPVLRAQVGERARAIQTGYVNEPKIQAIYAEIVEVLQHWNRRREDVVRQLMDAVQSTNQLSLREIRALAARANWLAQGFELDAEVLALRHQIERETVQREQKHDAALQELNSLLSQVGQRHSIAGLLQVLEKGKSLAASFLTESDVVDASLSLQRAVEVRRGILDNELKQVQTLDEAIRQAATVVDAENALDRARTLASEFSPNSVVQDLLARLAAQVRGRRIEHDLIVQELKTIASGIDLIQSLSELAAVEQRTLECQRQHARDPHIQSLASQILSNIQIRRESLAITPADQVTVISQATPVVDEAELAKTPSKEPEVLAGVGRRRKNLLVVITVLTAALGLGGLVWKVFLLPRRPVQVEISSVPAGASIRINGVEQKCMPAGCTLTLVPGTYQLDAQLQGYQDYKQTITVTAGSPQALSIHLINNTPPAPAPGPSPAISAEETTEKGAEPQSARLEIKGGPPGAMVIIDGRSLGKIKANGEFLADIDPGDHQLKLIAGKQLWGIIAKHFSKRTTTVLRSGDFAPPPAAQPAEELDWKKVRDSGNIQDLDSFLQHYPNGVFRLEAENRREDLYWARAKNEGTASALTDYLKRYHDGRYSDQAKNDLAALDWKSIETSGDVNRVEDFIGTHTSGEYHDKAVRALDELMWGRSRGGNIDGLRTYLQRFPHGVHADEARSKLDQLAKPKEAEETVGVVRPTPPAASPPKKVDDAEAVLLIPKEYKKAYEDKNVAELKRIWPSMSGPQEKGLASAFKNASSVKLDYSVISEPEISGDYATIGLSIHLVIDGKSPMGGGSVTMKLKRTERGDNERWEIESIK